MEDFDITFWRPVTIRIVPANAPRHLDRHYFTSALGVLIEFTFDTDKETSNADLTVSRAA